ncbi:substrate-binding domain-containing protein [Schaalia sp. 19OD2882]|uniref:LacI family DNA-binding transcriptional regulator n=1 Tax=Schaalia sp. 19OD2882 TaxID=2794089 RepID=UPI001C1EA46D|nr:substrate-binding domain-containing protein [Schaalia sp. 19OD2882]QWW19425.1 substrate-binding domain-containing protein [Schaalia sp. 19OD2882]
MSSKRERRPPVISDVAACAGVSVSTVSRYLNNSAHLSEDSAQRIARAIDLLGYRPSSIARGLKGSTMNLIAVLSTNTALLGSAITIQGIEDEARIRRHSVMISKLDDSGSSSLSETMRTVLDLNPSGVIVLRYDAIAEKALESLPSSLPVVVIGGRQGDGRDQVSLCEKEGGQALTDHLLALGHATVHHIQVPTRTDGTSRSDGWEESLCAHGIVVPHAMQCGWEARAARALGRELAAARDVTAVFAGNDELAMGFIRGLQEAGRRVPDEISVVGFDDHPLSDIWNPGLTTYRQDFARAGQAAVDLLLKRRDAKTAGTDLPPQTIRVPGQIIVRDSAGPCGLSASSSNCALAKGGE